MIYELFYSFNPILRLAQLITVLVINQEVTALHAHKQLIQAAAQKPDLFLILLFGL